MKIPGLHLQRIDMQVTHENVTRGDNRLRCIPRIRPTTMGNLIAAAGRSLELLVTIGKTHEVT